MLFWANCEDGHRTVHGGDREHIWSANYEFLNDNDNYNSVIDDYRLVSGSGDIKLTKDGNVLLHEMVM